MNLFHVSRGIIETSNNLSLQQLGICSPISCSKSMRDGHWWGIVDPTNFTYLKHFQWCLKTKQWKNIQKEATASSIRKHMWWSLQTKGVMEATRTWNKNNEKREKQGVMHFMGGVLSEPLLLHSCNGWACHWLTISSLVWFHFGVVSWGSFHMPLVVS
jgi:hypothetical protein